MPRPKTDHVKLTLRLPPELHVRLEEVRRETDRSLNSEIVQRIRQSFKDWRQM